MASKLVQFQPMNLLTSSACSVIKRIVRVALCYRLMQLWHFSRAYKPPAGIYNWAGRRTLTVNRLFKTKVQRIFSLLWNKEKGVKQTCSNLVRWFSRLLQYPGFHLKNKSTKLPFPIRVVLNHGPPFFWWPSLILTNLSSAFRAFFQDKRETRVRHCSQGPGTFPSPQGTNTKTQTKYYIDEWWMVNFDNRALRLSSSNARSTTYLGHVSSLSKEKPWKYFNAESKTSRAPSNSKQRTENLTY